MSVETVDSLYLIEFKVDMPEKKAFARIRAKDYAEKYQLRKKLC
ncbi:MAG: hypothetical protein CSA26_05890 [Desulfobacterales bacterium]|nr:MAG: hypothetical protein CSA26_05890 [Desulfobacterales bacterium]